MLTKQFDNEDNVNSIWGDADECRIIQYILYALMFHLKVFEYKLRIK